MTPRTSELVFPTGLLLELTRRYTEPHRHYHGLPHIAWMLDQARELVLDDDQVLAIWFHDAVYDVPGHDNEERSAALAVERLSAAGLPEARVRKIERIVLDTKAHVPTSEASKLVMDLDLASLALARPEFVKNGARIRAEYADIDDATFTAGRRTFMEAFLARERIYWTDWGAALEDRARENLRLDLAGSR
jgi:predicted metal-dependent HD superfamily phosphohydrolase